MDSKPKLLVYAVSWNEKRNLLFSHYLSDYFKIIVISYITSNEKLFEFVKPTKVISTKFWFKQKVGLSFSLKFGTYIRKYNPDFVLTIETHSISSYQSIKLSNKFNFKSVIFSWQNVETIPKYFFQKHIQRKVLLKSNYLLGGTSDTKRYLIKKGAEKNKIFINPETGFDSRIFFNNGEDFRQIWNFEKSDFIILYVGRLVNEKGIELILNVAKKFESKFNDIKFVFVGKGNYYSRIYRIGIKNIFVKEYQNYFNMGKVMRTCNLFIYPSLTTKFWVEQFGYSVIEAQACGKPTIVSNSGTLPKLVQNEVNGSIIKEGDELELATKILWWYNKLKKNKYIKNDFVNKFNAQNISSNYKKILLKQDSSLLNSWF